MGVEVQHQALKVSLQSLDELLIKLDQCKQDSMTNRDFTNLHDRINECVSVNHSLSLEVGHQRDMRNQDCTVLMKRLECMEQLLLSMGQARLEVSDVQLRGHDG